MSARGDEGGVVLTHIVLLAVDYQYPRAFDNDHRFLWVVEVGAVGPISLEGGDTSEISVAPFSLVTLLATETLGARCRLPTSYLLITRGSAI